MKYRLFSRGSCVSYDEVFDTKEEAEKKRDELIHQNSYLPRGKYSHRKEVDAYNALLIWEDTNG